MLKTYTTTMGRATLPIASRQGKLLFYVTFDAKVGDSFSYSTAAQKEQKAIEECVMYKKGIIKLYSTVQDAPTEEDEATAHPSISITPSVNDTNNDTPTPAEELTFPSWQSAKSWLIKEKGVDPNTISTPDEVADKAKEIGVNITF